MLAARVAIGLAKVTGAELHVVHVGPKHVYPPPTAGPTPPTGTDKEIRNAAQRVLDWQVDEIKKAGGDITQAHLRVGKPDEEQPRARRKVVPSSTTVTYEDQDSLSSKGGGSP